MNTQRIIRFVLSIFLISFFLLHATQIISVPFFKQLENLAYDARLNIGLPNTVDKRIVIVDIDEKSLKEIGRFPWNRDIISKMINNLFQKYKVKLVAFDIVFAEEEETSANKILQQLSVGKLRDNASYQKVYKKLKHQLDNDRKLAQSFENRNVILGYYFKNNGLIDNSLSTGQLPKPVISISEKWLDKIPFIKPKGYGANISLLQNATNNAGYFDNPLVDADGIFRRVPILQEFNNQLYESLALSIARKALGSPKVQLLVADTGSKNNKNNYLAIESVQLGKTNIPVDKNSSVLVPYLGRQGSFPYISATDIIKNQANKNILKNAIVIVGATAPGLLDLRSTPVQHIYPGVEVHANIVSGILDNRIKQIPDYTIGYEVFIILIIGIILAILTPKLSPLFTSILAITLAALLLIGNYFVWSNFSIVLPIATPILFVITMFIFHMSYGFFVETRGKRELAKVFGQYIPPELVNDMAYHSDVINLSGESKKMTVLFSDVRGFTNISESLESKELAKLMNAFLTPMTRIIHKNRGTIDKYMGDAIMCFWGAPLDDKQHASNAIKAAIEMIAELKRLQPRFKKNGWPEIKIGVGINSSEMTVGNMGSEFRMAYTVMGDAVNLGSRLESLTKTYRVGIIVSEYTKFEVPEYEYRELDLVRVKGKNKPVAIFEPVSTVDKISPEDKNNLKRFHQAIRLYRHQQWEKAELEFYQLSKIEPDIFIHQLYMNRIIYFKDNPPSNNWDGAFTFTTK